MIVCIRHLRRLAPLCATLVVAVVAAPAGAAVHAQTASTRALPAVLSNETTDTRWANADASATVRQRASSHSRQVARLRYFTEDGFPEVYLALRSHRDTAGRMWIRLRLPGRPNGRLGWVPRDALGALHLVHTHLIVDRHRLTATLYRNGRRIFHAPVGVGKASTPTPAGRFWIRERLRLSSSAGIYGSLAFGTAAYSILSDWPGGGVVGVHGTNQPYLVPGRPSHGCIRMHNRDILRLGRLMPIGTPLRIL